MKFLLPLFLHVLPPFIPPKTHSKSYISLILSDNPSKPGTPEIISYDHMTCDIKWGPSESDGGSPITHYIIQTRTNNGDWIFDGNFQTPTGSEKLEYQVTGLTENDKVQFRAIAVNKGGESPPSDPSPLHTVKHSKCKYKEKWKS